MRRSNVVNRLEPRAERLIQNLRTPCVWRITDFPRISNSPHTPSRRMSFDSPTRFEAPRMASSARAAIDLGPREYNSETFGESSETRTPDPLITT